MPALPELSRRAVLEQLGALLSRLDLPARVAIDGPDAAGKTAIADELATILAAADIAAARISADDFLNPMEWRYGGGRDSPEGYYEHSFDYPALRASVNEADGLVLVDGVFLQRPDLDDLWSFRVFVAVSEEESLRRGVRRDRALHESTEDAERLYRTRYLPGQRFYAAEARPRDRADVVVDNERPAAPRLIVRKGLRPPNT